MVNHVSIYSIQIHFLTYEFTCRLCKYADTLADIADSITINGRQWCREHASAVAVIAAAITNTHSPLTFTQGKSETNE